MASGCGNAENGHHVCTPEAPEAPEGTEFIPCESGFQGSKEGYVFKAGLQGTGYYLDKGHEHSVLRAQAEEDSGFSVLPPAPPPPEPRRRAEGGVTEVSAAEAQQLFNKFQEAVRDGTKEQILDALDLPGFPADFRSPTGRRALHLVAERGFMDGVRFLLDELGAMLYVVDNKGKSALHYAAKSGSPETVEFLLERGLDPTGKMPQLLPEDAAAQKRWDKDDHGPYGCETPLHWAVFSHRLGIAKLLLDRSGDPSIADALDDDGETVVHWAAHHGRIGLLRQLANELGCTVSKPSKHGTTALHYAAENGEMEMLRMLVEDIGVPIDVADCHGNTPLHSAVEFDNKEVVDYFLSRPGCPLERENEDGLTAEDVATESRAGNGIAVLLEAAREGRLGAAREELLSSGKEREQLRQAVAMAKRLSAEG